MIASIQTIELPVPASDCTMTVFHALQRRQTTRQISEAPLSPQILSNLLWAGCGVNRKAGPFGLPGRTAASASNSHEIGVFVAMRDCAYRYDALAHRLDLVARGDLRTAALTPGQRGIEAKAPVQLIYVVDLERLLHTEGFDEPGLHEPEVQKSYYYVDTGLIAGNVYLFAAAEGLAAWFHNCNRAALASQLGLRAAQRVLFAQSVGYPAEAAQSSPNTAR
ncbi:MAG: nitroreductase family protein [Steroidobacteraceae bacterium]|jgi:hypothetical protein